MQTMTKLSLAFIALFSAQTALAADGYKSPKSAIKAEFLRQYKDKTLDIRDQDRAFLGLTVNKKTVSVRTKQLNRKLFDTIAAKTRMSEQEKVQYGDLVRQRKLYYSKVKVNGAPFEQPGMTVNNFFRLRGLVTVPKNEQERTYSVEALKVISADRFQAP